MTHSTHDAPPRWRRLVHLLAVLALMLTVAVATSRTAAAVTGYPAGEHGTYHGQSTQWGTMTINGRYSMCLDPLAMPPHSLDDATAAKICGNQTDGKPDRVAQLAYLTAKYVTTTDNHLATSLSQFSRGAYHPDIPVFYPDIYERLAAEAERDAGPKTGLAEIDLAGNRIWYGLVRDGESTHTSAHHIGGYQATVTLTTPNVTFADGFSSMTVTTSSDPAWLELRPRHDLVADEPVTASITIQDVPASCYLLHWDGTTQRTITPLYQTITGTGKAAPTETRWQPKLTTSIVGPVAHPGTGSVTDVVTGRAVGGSQWPVREWADAIQTQPKTHVGFTATGQTAKSAVAPAPSQTLPAGAQILPGGPFTAVLPGPGVPVTASVPLPANPGAGHYAVRWCLDPADQGPDAKYLPKTPPVCDAWFATDERFTVPMRINVASGLPQQHQLKGQAPDDTVTLTLPDEADQWITATDGEPAQVIVDGTFYAGSASTFVISDTPPADAKVLGASSVTVTLPTSGREPVAVAAPAGFTVPTSQYGTWVWRIDPDRQSDTVRPVIDHPVADRFGQPGETHVTQMDLVIQSHVLQESVTEPTGSETVQVCDKVWVEHTSPGDLWLDQWGTDQPVQVSVTGSVFHSAVPAAQTIPAGDVPAVEDYQLTFTAAGENNAQTVCHTIQYGEYGAYGFQYSIDPDAQPQATKDYLSKKTTTPLWLPAETTIVKRTPIVHTTATSWDTTTAGVATTYFQDDLWQTDWPDAASDTDLHNAAAHGRWDGYGPWQPDGKTVTVELWRIEGPVGPDSCTTRNPAATLVASNSTTPAVNTWGGAQKVSGSRFKASGGDAAYTFVVSWPGDARTEPYRSVCGEPSETITVTSQTPGFVTQVMAPADADRSSITTAQAQTTGLTVQPGQELVDVLHTWTPDHAARPADTSGWTASWQAYFLPTDQQAHPLEIVTDPSRQKVYSGAVCTPDTLHWASDQPVSITQSGAVVSPVFTAPEASGALFLVETVTDRSGDVVRRGACGAVSESAIIPTPPAPPQPTIGTQAPADATVGQQIRDTATLIGPYPAGTIVEFWVQHTAFVDPGMPADQLRCVTPDPHDMTGAILAGTVVLDRALAEGETGTVVSPEFTADQTGCTHIKEIAFTPDTDGGDPVVVAEGWFGQASETTRWHGPHMSARTGGTVSTAGTRIGAVAAGLAAVGAGVVLIINRRRAAHR